MWHESNTVNVVGATPVRDDFDRGLEIAAWAEAHSVAEADFVILEDAEVVEPFEHRTVRPRFRGQDAGFRADHDAAAVRLMEDSA
ncbi:MAG: hypothetical protein AAGA48_39435 [Myxococcota bacterium]